MAGDWSGHLAAAARPSLGAATGRQDIGMERERLARPLCCRGLRSASRAAANASEQRERERSNYYSNVLSLEHRAEQRSAELSSALPLRRATFDVLESIRSSRSKVHNCSDEPRGAAHRPTALLLLVMRQEAERRAAQRRLSR